MNIVENILGKPKPKKGCGCNGLPDVNEEVQTGLPDMTKHVASVGTENEDKQGKSKI